MGNNIKGITIEIGGDTGPLSNALKGVNKTSNDLQSELKEVNRQLKFDPTNTDLLKQKQTLLAKEINNTKDKLNTLKEAQQQAKAQFESGTLGEDKYRALQREVIKTESQLKNLEKQAGLCEANLSKISTTAGKVGNAAEKAGQKMLPATLAIAAAGTAAIKLGSDAIESSNKVDVAFGKSADQVKAFSETTLEKFGIASGSALDMASTFGDMATSMGLPTNKAADMSTKLVGLAGDLSSFKNIKLDESATALNSIFTGETESLKKLGIVMTETNLKSFALSEGIKKPIDKMSEAEKVQLRYNYVMNATKNAQGDFARTSDGAANSMRVASESAKEAGESFGVMLAPIVAKVSQLVSSLVKNFAGLDTGTKQIILTILGIVAAVAPALLIVSKIAAGISAVTKAMALMKTVTMAEAAAQTSWNAALLANPVTWIVVAIVAAVALLVIGIKHLWDTNEGFRTAVTNIWNNIKAVVSGVVNALVTFFTVTIPQAWNGLVAFFQGIPAWWSALWTQIGQFFTNCWNGIISFFTTTIPQWIQAVITWFNELPYKIGYAIGEILAGIVNFGISAWQWVTVQLPIIINGIITWFSQLPGKIWTFLVDIVTKIGQWGANMVQKASVEVPLFINRVVTFYAELPGKIWTFLVDIVSKVVQWCGNLISTAGTEIPKFVSTVVSFISELPNKMLDIGSNIVHGIWDGINGAVSWLHDRISDFCSGIVKGFKDKLKIHSPSVLFADVIGKNLALGIGQGFTENMKAVVASMTAAIPTTWDTGIEVRTAMAAAYGGYSVPVSTRQTAVESTSNPTAQTGGINVNQYFQGKVPTPAENARLTRNGLQQVILKLRK